MGQQPSGPPRRGVTPLVLIGAGALPAGLLAVLLLRIFPPTDGAPALVASFIPYGVLAEVIALCAFGLAAVLARRRVALAVLAVVTARAAGPPAELAGAAVPAGRPAADDPDVHPAQPQHPR